MWYRKKPVIIEAIRWTGFYEDYDRINQMSAGRQVEVSEDGASLVVHTIEGDMMAHIGDWIIKGIQGEIYPCRNNIFQATYEEVSDE